MKLIDNHWRTKKQLHYLKVKKIELRLSKKDKIILFHDYMVGLNSMETNIFVENKIQHLSTFYET